MFQWHQNVEAIKFPDQENFTGVNTLKDLSVTNQKLIHEKIDSLLSEGVIFLDKDSVYIESQVVIGAGAIIHPNVHLYGQTIIGKNSLIEPGTIIKNSVIGEDVQILGNSYLEGSSISSRATIGPFARIRPESKIAEGAKVGNFVEVKKSTIGKNAKVSHLSYVGDATIGENSNIGCGFISVNYDGKHKHQTTIGKDSFIGSGVEVIAPITIGDRSFVAAGSTLNHDVPDEAFAIAREKQVTKQGLAKKFLKKS
jgi:bifunctional UDP-N-acetylglucosamine pyrophosphorylase/glucosamine-1-phosphate N-acetyltransferase